MLVGILLLQHGRHVLPADVDAAEGTCGSGVVEELRVTGSRENDENDSLNIAAAVGASTTPPPTDGGDLGVPQRLDHGISVKEFEEHLDAARLYMASDRLKEININPEVLENCRNKHESCVLWR